MSYKANDTRMINNSKIFVLTGGPCGGKSTAVPLIANLAAIEGYHVILVPEIARIFIGSGIDPRGLDPFQNHAIQLAISRTQVNFEEAAKDYSFFKNKPCLILCDRGLSDNGAYMPRANWHKVLNYLHLTPLLALQRYDAVFHLETAANGAEEHYKNDSVRTDTIEEAVKLDDLTMMQWDTHRNFHFIRNPIHGGFEGKMQILREHVLEELKRK
jgi:predicted ATPase